MNKEYKVHELANLFPLMHGHEYRELKNSIKENGLREPIVLHKGKILDGRNRYRACCELGIEILTCKPDGDPLKIIIDLNLHRRHLSESQRAMVAASIANLNKGDNQHSPIGLFTTQDDAAKTLNVGTTSLKRAKQVKEKGTDSLVDAVEQGRIAVFQAAILSNESTETQNAVVEKVNSGIKPVEAKRQVRKEQLPDMETPEGKYRIIYADPPWKYGDTRDGVSGYSAAADHYPAMTITELCELPVAEMADENAVLFLWVTSPFLEDGFKIVNSWGFNYKSSFIWDKVGHNVGHYNSVRHEYLLICTKGRCLPDISTLHDSVIEIEKTRTHSEKPEYFRELIDTMYTTGSRIELFKRGKAPDNWDVWGNQAVAI